MDKINIALITDTEYLLTTVVAVRSLVAHIDHEKNYVLYIIGEKEVEDIWKEKFETDFGSNINLCFVEAKIQYTDLETVHFYVSKAALLKFQLPNLLSHLEKVLYLDGDILIRRDIAELYQTDIQGYYAAVVKDMLTYEGDHLSYLQIDEYFNSGVMLLNLELLRKDKASERLWEYKKKQSKHIFMDQDAFNMTFRERVLFLSPKYNFITECMKNHSKAQIANFYCVSEEEIENPIVVHMAGPDKPWKEYENDRYVEWFSYLRNSEEISRCLREYFRQTRTKIAIVDDKTNALERTNIEQEKEIQRHNQVFDELLMRLQSADEKIRELTEKTCVLKQEYEELNRVTNCRIEGNEREIAELKRRIDVLERTFMRRIVGKIKSIANNKE